MGRTAVLTVLVLLALGGCSSSGSVKGSPGSGPAQDIDLLGAPTIHWATTVPASSSAGTVISEPLPLPPATPTATDCYSWSDSGGAPHWAAQIVGTADGHRLVLQLQVDNVPVPPLGTHTTSGDRPPSSAILTVDDRRLGGTYINPSDGMPSYFTVDNNGTTGRISIRFADHSGAPQAWDAEGRWHCA